MTDITPIEKRACSALAALPLGPNLPLRGAFPEGDWGAIKWFIYEFLSGDSWLQGQGIDDLYPTQVHHSEDSRVEVLGWACLLANQRLIPIQLEFELSPQQDRVLSARVRMGERDGSGCNGRPFSQGITRHPVPIHDIEWYYDAEFHR